VSAANVIKDDLAYQCHPHTRYLEVDEQYTYFAIVNDLSPDPRRPYGILRRRRLPSGGNWDEHLTSELEWKTSGLMMSAERGDLTNEFIEISHEEVARLIEQFVQRHKPGDTGRP
jgi:hypothetical protein